jgi:biotin-dependent carboxylase-like uncharacterized protein
MTGAAGQRAAGIEVVAPGPLTTVQDLGRPGHAALGVCPSGAADRPALLAANRVVGNEPEAACLEVTFGGLSLRCDPPAVLAVTGARCPAAPYGEAVETGALQLGRPASGLRSYVAVRGGVDVPPVLDSRSADLLSGIGPPALKPGDRLAVGSDIAGPPRLAHLLAPSLPEPVPLRTLPGPRADWAAGTLVGSEYVVSAASNRVGVRLQGPPVRRAQAGELGPEGLLAGAVQLPPDGRPIVSLADHPVTGGYPVVAVIIAADVALLAQCRPGTRVVLAAA